MRFVFLIISFFIFSANTSAKCMAGLILLMNEGKPVVENGIVILEFYGESQQLVSSLNKKHPVFLQCGETQIPLSVVEVLQGEFRVTQVVLKSTAQLKKNKAYRVVISNLTKQETFIAGYNLKGKNWQSTEFKVAEAKENKFPVFAGSIEEVEKSFIRYGCGPASAVVFKLATITGSPFLVRASVKNKMTGKVTNYIVAVDKGILSIGHGMCSGPFHFDDGNDFELTIALMDDAGNKSEQTLAVSFSKPNSGNHTR